VVISRSLYFSLRCRVEWKMVFIFMISINIWNQIVSTIIRTPNQASYNTFILLLYQRSSIISWFLSQLSVPASLAISEFDLHQGLENFASITHLKQLIARDCLQCEAHLGGWCFKCFQWSFINSRLSCFNGSWAFQFGCAFDAN
jgi:hypothetical protein